MPSDTVAVLVDADNFYPRASHQTPELFRHELNRLVDEARARFNDFGRLELRYYGGWLQDGTYTTRASEFLQLLGQSGIFPLPHPSRPGLLRGRAALAVTLLAAPRVQLVETCRSKPGLPRIRVETAGLANCRNNKAYCPTRALSHFSRSPNTPCPVDGCSLTARDVFFRREQKMVDTMLACDILWLALQDDCGGILVCSNDVDVVPPLVVAMQTVPIALVKRGTATERDSHYQATIASAGIQVRQWG